MATEVDKLREAIEALTLELKRGPTGAGGGESKAPKISEEDIKNKKKETTAFSKVNQEMMGFARSLFSIGAVLRGLHGTVEGFNLNYSIQHVLFEIADLLRDPIRLITRELEGFARLLHTLDSMDSGGPGKGGKGGHPTTEQKLTALGTKAAVGAGVGAVVAGPWGAILGGLLGGGSQLKKDLDAAINGPLDRAENKEELYRSRRALAERAVLAKDPVAEARAMQQLHAGWAEAEREHKFQQDQRSQIGGHVQRLLGKVPDWMTYNSKRAAEHLPGGQYNEELDLDARRRKSLYEAGIRGIENLKEQTKNEAPRKDLPQLTPIGIRTEGDRNAPSDRLQQMLHVSFGDVAGLQMKMQQLVVENPAQKQGLSLIERCAGFLEQIRNEITSSTDTTIQDHNNQILSGSKD